MDVDVAVDIGFGWGLCPGPAGAVWRWNLTNVHLHLRWTHLAVITRRERDETNCKEGVKEGEEGD